VILACTLYAAAPRPSSGAGTTTVDP